MSQSQRDNGTHSLFARVPALHENSIREEFRRLGRQFYVRRLAFFGSILRADYTGKSDVDILVEFEPGNAVGLLGLSEIQLALSDLLGRPVDLRILPELSHYFRDRVAKEALEFYVA